jgi:hypothetical protein
MMEVGVGDNLETFYLALRANDIDALVDSLANLEDLRSLLPSTTADREVLDEIVSDCQRKTGSMIRGVYSEKVRNIITNCRQRLRSKAALDSESSIHHGSRHLNALVELLGSWSNIISEILEYELSLEVLHMCISPLHNRIAEASFDCFESFREDKNLESLFGRLIASQNSTISKAGNSEVSSRLNISSLDYQVSQLADMRGVVQQYQNYLCISFSSSYQVPVMQCVDPPPSLPSLAYDKEMLKWKEVEGVYVVLEGGYTATAIQDALSLHPLPFITLPCQQNPLLLDATGAQQGERREGEDEGDLASRTTTTSPRRNKGTNKEYEVEVKSAFATHVLLEIEEGVFALQVIAIRSSTLFYIYIIDTRYIYTYMSTDISSLVLS